MLGAPPNLAIDAVMFDLDGTLSDPKIGITTSVQYALAKFGIEISDRDQLIPFIGPPLIESFERYYGLSHEQAKEAVSAYREYFGVKGLYENELYPGIPELLAALKARGIALGVATSKAGIYAEQIVEHFGIAGYFDIVVGSNLDHTRVAKAEVIAHLRDTHSAFATERIVMIGDREHDVLGAAAHGISTIGVAYGYGSLEELTSAGAIAVAQTVNELGVLLGGGAVNG
jgi:phosphoglycolate phosphatase